MTDLRSPLAVARDEYLEGKGALLWRKPSCNVHPIYLRNRIECAWIDGVTYAVTCIVDNRSKVAAPGWLKGKP